MVIHDERARQALIEQRLRARVEGRKSQAIPRRGEAGAAPLSTAQRRIWFLYQLDPSSPVFNRPVAMRLSGKLDRDALTAALSEIVRRHESLRTIFPDRNGEPFQVVLPAASALIDFLDLRGIAPDAREAEARRIACEESRRPFDLANGPVLRAKLLQIDEQEHVLLLLMHHIIFDGWSENVLLHELRQIYSALARGQSSLLPEIPIQYADFADWQQRRLHEEGIARQIDYWGTELASIPASLNLPTDYARQNSPRWLAGRCVLDLSAALSDDLKDLSRRERVSLFMTLLAAFQLLLAHHADEDDIVVGVPIAGRNRVETEVMIGCFMNVLVMRMNVADNPSVREFLARVREKALQAYANQEVPFEKIVEALRPDRHPDRWPLFQVMFHLRNLPKPEAGEADDLAVEPFEFEQGVIGGLDLSLEIEETTGGLHCSLQYDTGLFRCETTERMMERFRNLLEAMVRDPEQRVWDLPILTRSERRRLLVEWNDTAAEFPSDLCLHQLFECQVEKTPDAVAAIFEGRQLTYRELNRRSNQLANHLRRLGAGPEELIGICLDRSLEMLVALIGVLKSGAAYVPLDPAYPQERLTFLIRDAQAKILITQPSLVERLGTPPAQILCLDGDTPRFSREDDQNPASGVASDNLAYVIYTSGSTGKPKGVMIRHRSICNFVSWRTSYFPLTAGDRLLQRASFSFDDSVWEFFEPLSVGATVVLPSVDGHRDPAYLVDLMIREQVTAGCFVPSMLKLLLDESRISECTSLRRLSTGGEVVPVEVHDQFLARLRCELYNGYGPTETTVASTYFHCRRDNKARPISIGRPVANTQIYFLGRRRQLVPLGAVGEIYIAGEGLARGYLNRPELTAEKFIPNPFSSQPGERLYRTGDLGRYLPDGNIEFLGRIDHQVKVRGFRIELEEIEAVLCQHSAVRQVAVIAREDHNGDQALAAYYVLRIGQTTVSDDLRRFLRDRLPDYMVPSTFVELDAIPYLTSGKLDRASLPAPEISQAQSDAAPAAPQTATEEALAEIWSSVLGVGSIGREDDFFYLGGHSASAARVIHGAQQSFGVKISLLDLFRQPTLAGMAALIDAGR